MEVDADRPTAQEPGGLDPFLVVLHRPASRLLVGVRQWAFVVDHDQMVHDAGVATSLEQFLQVGGVLARLAEVHGPAAEEAVDVLDDRDAEVVPALGGKVQMVEPAGIDRPMQRPLRQGDLDPGRGGFLRSHATTGQWQCGRQQRPPDEASTCQHVRCLHHIAVT